MRRVASACAGALLWVASVALYAADGFGLAVGLLWLFGLALVGTALFEQIARPARIDLLAPLFLMAAFAPLYVIRARSTRPWRTRTCSG
ncbi:MAG: hypothetical protein E6G24_02350 [Actinobacteria bacterium]|nr:MAG: hypothetical protein E6G24_02350 [Actinomycetota bacterium]